MSEPHTAHLALIGHPIGHSLSPLMHNTALNALGLHYDYRAIDIEPSRLKETIQDLIAEGCFGFNVTIPHKESIIPLLQTFDDEAKSIGAVNTVIVRDGKLHGYNTDVYGVLKSLEPYRSRIEGRNVLLLGAGGAARAVLYCLANNFKPSHIVMATRTLERGKQLAETFTNIQSTSLHSLTDSSIDRVIEEATLIINATPVGMTPHVGSSPLPTTAAFHREQIVFDLIYSPLETTLLLNATSKGATVIGGLEMFLYQGAKAFELFTGKPMPVDVVRKVVEQELTH